MRRLTRAAVAFGRALLGQARERGGAGGRRRLITRKLRELYDEESWEVGAALARAARAREEGAAEVAALLEELARDEARHLSLVVRLLHPAHIERDAHVNLSTTLDGDRGAAARARELATLAREAGLDREAALFETLAADELHHAAKLEAALRRLGTDAGAREATERRP